MDITDINKILKMTRDIRQIFENGVETSDGEWQFSDGMNDVNEILDNVEGIIDVCVDATYEVREAADG